MTTFPANRTEKFQKLMDLNSTMTTGRLILNYQNLSQAKVKGLVIAALRLSLIHRGINRH